MESVRERFKGGGECFGSVRERLEGASKLTEGARGRFKSVRESFESRVAS